MTDDRITEIACEHGLNKCEAEQREAIHPFARSILAASVAGRSEQHEQAQIDFDTWQAHPYTKTLLESIKNDYRPIGPTPPVAAGGDDARELVDACAPYLKDGETPAECIAHNRKDAEAVYAYYSDAHRWRYVRDHWGTVTGMSFPTDSGKHPSWVRSEDPDKLTAFVDEQRARLSAVHGEQQ